MHQIPDIFNLSVAYNDPIVRAILLAVILDFITGISKAITERRLNSTTSSKGLIKQFLYATVPASYSIALTHMSIGRCSC